MHSYGSNWVIPNISTNAWHFILDERPQHFHVIAAWKVGLISNFSSMTWMEGPKLLMTTPSKIKRHFQQISISTTTLCKKVCLVKSTVYVAYHSENDSLWKSRIPILRRFLSKSNPRRTMEKFEWSHLGRIFH